MDMNAHYRTVAVKSVLFGSLVAFAGGCWAVTLMATEPKQETKPKYNAEELRKKYPYESVAPRLEYEKQRVESEKDRPAPKLSAEAASSVKEMDAQLDPKGPMWKWTGVRSESLRLLHSDQVEKFIAREGFGLSRMPTPSPGELEYQSEPIPFAEKSGASSQVAEGRHLPLPTSEKVAAQAGNEFRLPPVDILGGLVRGNTLEFANAAGFGHVKDREHVAGFQSHQFVYRPDLYYPQPKPGEDPEKAEKWLMRSLELVSLLKHDKPAVYVSDHLPRMDDLKAAKTRPLSDFEAKSLEKLRGGEEFVADATANRIVMLGAVRASKQCLECHYVQRGELLGAFSYDLLRDPPIKTPAPAEKPAQ